MSEQNEEIVNEEVYEREYFPEPKKSEILGDCAECYDEVRSDSSYGMDVGYLVLMKNGITEGEQNHTEYYHYECFKIMEKRKHGK